MTDNGYGDEQSGAAVMVSMAVEALGIRDQLNEPWKLLITLLRQLASESGATEAIALAAIANGLDVARLAISDAVSEALAGYVGEKELS